jgi:Sigma-70 region 2
VRGSEAAFAEFASANIGRLTQFAELLTGDPHRAADLVQEALERAYLRWHKVDLDDPFAYVRQIIVNQYRNWWNRRRDREVPTSSCPRSRAASTTPRSRPRMGVLAPGLGAVLRRRLRHHALRRGGQSRQDHPEQIDRADDHAGTDGDTDKIDNPG